ncbi:uncharacterized protein KRP23_13341 [Phytophthora ramorum]|uniref:uncharacterized protein n=1 Tax=Phytophthora ramorum TaxID=164328 RepID=UPI0030A0BF2E|nr:hypothetical protein KRP23_13341 [Phytophthora ramorum]
MVRYRVLHGMCVGFEELRGMLQVEAETTGTRPLTDVFPNDKFIQRWLAKHSDLSPRTAQLLDIDRASASTADVVSHYFNNLQRVLKKLDLLDKPNRIWNCDETGICPQATADTNAASFGITAAKSQTIASLEPSCEPVSGSEDATVMV